MHANREHKILSFWMVGLLVLTLGPAAQAVDYSWTGAGSNAYWHNPENWGGSGAPTTTNDTAIFDNQAAEPYTVKFDANNTNKEIRVSQDTVAMDLNGYTNALPSAPHTGVLYVGYNSEGKTGSLHVAGGGTLNMEDGTLYLPYGTNSKGMFVLSRSNTVLNARTLYLGRSANSLGVFRHEDGAQATMVSLISGAAATGVGKVIVSNATITTSYTHLGHVAGGRGEMLFTGPDARWMRDGSPEAYVGQGGSGELTVSNGAQVHHGMWYLIVGQNETATGTVTVVGTGSIIGGTQADSAVLSVALGGNDRGTIEEPPAAGGVGTLNLFDGGILQGRGTSIERYFFIGTESRIRIRDGSINWCIDGSYRNQPFLFSPGSYYAVELTAASEAFTAETPLIWSGADEAGATRTNLINNANLELKLVDDFVPNPGAVFRIFKYSGDLEGTFTDLPEGTEFHAQQTRFRINYGSRTDDTITLTALPSLGTMLIVH